VCLMSRSMGTNRVVAKKDVNNDVVGRMTNYTVCGCHLLIEETKKANSTASQRVSGCEMRKEKKSERIFSRGTVYTEVC